jgi:hypothetical protein
VLIYGQSCGCQLAAWLTHERGQGCLGMVAQLHAHARAKFDENKEMSGAPIPMVQELDLIYKPPRSDEIYMPTI